jgi:hypothetical protein
MRANEFVSEEQKLDEVLPLIVGGAAIGLGAAAAGIGSGIGGVASGVGAVAKGAGKAVGAVGNLAAKGINKVAGTNKPQKVDPVQAQDIDRAKDQLIRPGKNIILPTQGPGGPQAFKVTKVQGDEVEIENPEGNKSPNQPNKLVYKKSDVKSTINI